MSIALKNLIDKLSDRINQQDEAIRQLERRIGELEKLKEKWTTLHLPRSSK